MEERRGTFARSPRDDLPATDYDYVIVGAGIYGLPLAYFLKKRDAAARVLVVEDNTIPGQGITVNTGGIIRACYSNPDVMAAAAFGRPYFATPSETMKLANHVDTGFVAAGWGRFVNVREAPGIVSELERIAGSARKLGIPGIWHATFDEYCERLSPDRRANLGKIFDTGDVTHVLADDNGGYADGGSALVAFLEAALSQGADVALHCHVTGLSTETGAVSGVQYQRWRTTQSESGDFGRETVLEGEIRCKQVIVSAGAGSRRLIESELGLCMPTFPTYHQTPMVENTAEVGLKRTTYTRVVANDAGGLTENQVAVVNLPVISHWRDFYFHSEGLGVTVGAHHRELHDEEYVPRGGKIQLDDATIEVGLSQVMIDKVIEGMDHFPALASDGLRLGKRPGDVPGGFYVMNPEELPFEGPVPGTGDTLFYIGSGSGTGFKLGPGLACLLAQRITGVPAGERLISGSTLSVERNQYFYPAGTEDSQLRDLFEAASGRFRHVGASGIATSKEG